MKNIITKQEVVSILKLQANNGIYDGSPDTYNYLNSCYFFHKTSGTLLLFAREVGYHSYGWFKNPDYERCYHLSLSFKGIEFITRKIYDLPKNRKLTDEWVNLFFGDNKKLIWVEPPYSKKGKMVDVWHYRLFCNLAWQPIKPRKEVYSKDLTEREWKTFSELNDNP